ncbi:DUF1963 domain-containing protein [Catenuloplanes atrovinosus]|uniref:DUF1963 domain-containing protein n=1 Tax=Catenuloplanes atrovinosus TaxID=137266 RepID=A0AAE3YSQ8_9ACTN|nr:DUF1963 domain-containing protein [Catenuloplanes atrovinosus]MDR7279199.1 hypothetical protein [Catenuloplanes atrovinosus]
MDYQRQFRRAATDRGIPDGEVDRFAEFLRFAIWTGAHYDDGVPAGQRGGLPRLPVGMEWPSGEYGPLPFVASIDCAALPRVDGLALPADGSLLFFLHHEDAYEEYSVAGEQKHARVVHVPAGTDTVIAEEPEHAEIVFNNMTLDFVAPRRELRAVVAAELPEWLGDGDDVESTRDGDQAHLARDLPHLAELVALADELWPDRRDPEISLGGHSWVIGELATDVMYTTPETRIAEEAIAAREKAGEVSIPPGESALWLERETVRVMREWVPLMQFYPEDVYIGRFIIRHEDLAAGRFDRALSYTAFTE